MVSKHANTILIASTKHHAQFGGMAGRHCAHLSHAGSKRATLLANAHLHSGKLHFGPHLERRVRPYGDLRRLGCRQFSPLRFHKELCSSGMGGRGEANGCMLRSGRNDAAT